LTSGELAIDSAMRLAEAASTFGALDGDFHHLARALAVAHHLERQVAQQVVQRRTEIVERGVVSGDRGLALGCTGGKQHERVEVEVSLSTVTELKVGPTPASRAAIAAPVPGWRIGHDEGEHRRHVGRDHARALGDAVDASRSRSPSFAVRVATFG
jgi:hypothetical protein